MSLTIGFATPTNFWQSSFEQKQQALQQLTEAGVDQIFIPDHVSFRDGSGSDGFIEIAALSQLHPSLDVMIGVYLLPLRHPMLVARQLATMEKVAPGRTILGVGVGGEDRHEVEVCGVDPKTRGRRTDEMLEIIHQLMTGEVINYDGEFFPLEAAQIQPAITPPTPIIIGGRSNAALRRTGRFGDGWIGAWCSPRRFTEAVDIIDTAAAEHGRSDVQWRHGYQPWCGVAETTERARELVAAQMEIFYKMPFEAFEKYTPYGTPEQVAAQLQPYIDAGCSMLNLQIVAENDQASIEAGAEVIGHLRS